MGLTDGHTDKEYGEGNYEGARQYNKATKKFVESGRVEQAARDAEPSDVKEAREMADAEAEGKRRAKEEDPALTRGDNRSRSDESTGKPVTERSASETQTPKPGHGVK
ncbi:MAG TPA: hypothetical protein VNE58_08510 [Casimicrobiaceae bacterium]|nr:hypothetical protein [Casimicrobiaceae bacterium]